MPVVCHADVEFRCDVGSGRGSGIDCASSDRFLYPEDTLVLPLVSCAMGTLG